MKNQEKKSLQLNKMHDETIIAAATPPGRGGVAVIRLSGSLAYQIALQLTQTSELIQRTAHYVKLFNQHHEIIDQGLAIFFQSPASFTGEDIVEFHTHGSPIIVDLLIKEALSLGARLAKPGEFSERAFLNNKIDLIQAEAIADLIQAHSIAATKMAQRSLQGEFSKIIHTFNEELIHLRLYVEAAIDFPEEEIDFLGDGKIQNLLEKLIIRIHEIQSIVNQGVIIREGVSVVIAGRPNAGKSTLLNQLAGREIAIVTDIAGTTRDVMREHLLIDDLPIHLLDTAGLRESQDPIEQEGVKRALREIEQADLIIQLMDVADTEVQEDSLGSFPHDIPILRVFNKIDQNIPVKKEPHSVYISAKTGEGISDLKQAIKNQMGYQSTEGQFLARRRHLEALNQAESFLSKGKKQLLEHKAGELLAEDLRLAHQHICEITGEFTTDDLLGRIFSNFCIGK